MGVAAISTRRVAVVAELLGQECAVTARGGARGRGRVPARVAPTNDTVRTAVTRVRVPIITGFAPDAEPIPADRLAVRGREPIARPTDLDRAVSRASVRVALIPVVAALAVPALTIAAADRFGLRRSDSGFALARAHRDRDEAGCDSRARRALHSRRLSHARGRRGDCARSRAERAGRGSGELRVRTRTPGPFRADQSGVLSAHGRSRCGFAAPWDRDTTSSSGR